MAVKKEFTFASADGRTQIHAVEWRPETAAVQGILQIFHGMVEFIERYEAFAQFLTEKGFVVVGNDHLGHGASIVTKDDFGFFEEKHGNQVLLEDVHQLKTRTEAAYPDVPYFILGHSMGSFLLRQYVCLHGEGLDGAIIMGTGSQPLPVLKLGKGLCSLIAYVRGWRHRSRLIDKMAFGSYNKRFEPARTRVDWLTKDEKIVDAYLADERCTFLFTVNGYYNLFFSIEQASLEENLRKMPRDLPILFVAGKEDPVGDFGKGVEQVRRKFKKVGMTDVTWIFYENDRHEILNETDKDTVYKNLYAWLYVRQQEPRRKERGELSL